MVHLLLLGACVNAIEDENAGRGFPPSSSGCAARDRGARADFCGHSPWFGCVAATADRRARRAGRGTVVHRHSNVRITFTVIGVCSCALSLSWHAATAFCGARARERAPRETVSRYIFLAVRVGVERPAPAPAAAGRGGGRATRCAPRLANTLSRDVSHHTKITISHGFLRIKARRFFSLVLFALFHRTAAPRAAAAATTRPGGPRRRSESAGAGRATGRRGRARRHGVRLRPRHRPHTGRFRLFVPHALRACTQPQRKSHSRSRDELHFQPLVSTP